MGKRGPRPKGEYGGMIRRTAVVSTRLQPDTRRRLEAAAQVRGRSLSQELEHRLRRTFIEDEKAANFYGNQLNGAVSKLIAAVIQSAGTSWLMKTADGWIPDPSKSAREWLDDPRMFDEVFTAIFHALLWFKPKGSRYDDFIFYHSEAEQIIDEIRSADPSLSIERASTRQHAMAVLKDKLGDLVRHQHPYDDWREKEPPIRIAALNNWAEKKRG